MMMVVQLGEYTQTTELYTFKGYVEYGMGIIRYVNLWYGNYTSILKYF